MAKLIKEHAHHKGMFSFMCPGCKDKHYINTDHTKKGACWSFNNNMEAPTFKPSLLVRSGHYVTENKNSKDCWCNLEERTGIQASFSCYRCHSFITDGMIRFLDDCTHELAGQTVPLEEIVGH